MFPVNEASVAAANEGGRAHTEVKPEKSSAVKSQAKTTGKLKKGPATNSSGSGGIQEKQVAEKNASSLPKKSEAKHSFQRQHSSLSSCTPACSENGVCKDGKCYCSGDFFGTTCMSSSLYLEVTAFHSQIVGHGMWHWIALAFVLGFVGVVGGPHIFNSFRCCGQDKHKMLRL